MGMRYQPQGALRVAGSQLAEGLRLAVLPGVQRHTDAASGRQNTPTGTVKVGSPSGWAAGFGSSVGAGSTDKIVTPLNGTLVSRSYFFRGKRNGAGGGSLGRLFDKTSGSTGQFLYWSGTNSVLTYGYYAAGVEQVVQILGTGTTAAIGVFFDLVVTHDIVGTTHTVNAYVNGAQVVTNNVIVGSSTDAPSTALTIGNRSSDNARNWDGTIECAYVWGRSLTASDAAALYAGRYQVFRSPEEDDELLYVAAAGGGVSGSLAATLGSATLSATGAVALAGSMTGTLGAATTSSAGTASVAGSLSKTLGSLSSTSAGTLTIDGSLDKSLAPATLVASGTNGSTGVSGSLSQTLGAVVGASAGALTVSGSLAKTLGELSSAALVPAPNEYGATIMRASITNNEVAALIASIAAQAGTMRATLNQATIMRANPVNGAGTMRADAINQIAELL